MNLILLDQAEVGASGLVTLRDARAAHLRHVLQVTPGRQVRVGVLDGPAGVGTVSHLDEHAVVLRCAFDAATAQQPRVDLLLALPRPKVMRRLWAQLAALGVGRIILTNAERVERNYFDTHVLTPACYRPLLIEGLQQARDTHLPRVSIHRRLRILIEDELDALCGPAVRLMADPGEAMSIESALTPPAHDRVLIAVGPEGGWSGFERGLLNTHGFGAVGMGRRTLRTDTACVALLALVHHLIHRPPDIRSDA